MFYDEDSETTCEVSADHIKYGEDESGARARNPAGRLSHILGSTRTVRGSVTTTTDHHDNVGNDEIDLSNRFLDRTGSGSEKLGRVKPQ